MRIKRYHFACVVVALLLIAGAAMPRVRTSRHAKAQHQDSTANQAAQPAATTAASTAVAGTGTTGQLVKFAGDGTVVSNSIVTETKLGNIGVGTTTPGSKLTVQGLIETLSGGYKFPDGTIQTTASALTVPLVLRGSENNANGVVDATSTQRTGTGIFSLGGFDGGPGIRAFGGSSTTVDGGEGIFVNGGDGIRGGAGIFSQGGNAPNSDSSPGSGGDAADLTGGNANGMGNQGGTGVVANGGAGGGGAKPGMAGKFFGDVAITGSLSKGGGSFKIDHPLDPENKYLYHSFVESPDMKNIYDGTVTTDANGEATITMPDWFEALNQDFRYQLTVIDTFAQAIIAQKIKGNTFVVKTNAPNVEVCWQVTGTRHDAYANMHRIPVEEVKPEGERGLFLHPDAFNQPASKGLQAAQLARERARHQSTQR